MAHNMSNFYSYGKEAEIKCPVCGKMFKPAQEHSYRVGKNRNKLVCSYSCMRKWQNGRVDKLFTQTQKRRKSKQYGAVRIVETGEIFESIKECAEHLNTSYSNVHQAITLGVRCCGFHIGEIKEGESK